MARGQVDEIELVQRQAVFLEYVAAPVARLRVAGLDFAVDCLLVGVGLVPLRELLALDLQVD